MRRLGPFIIKTPGNRITTAVQHIVLHASLHTLKHSFKFHSAFLFLFTIWNDKNVTLIGNSFYFYKAIIEEKKKKNQFR